MAYNNSIKWKKLFEKVNFITVLWGSFLDIRIEDLGGHDKKYLRLW